MKHLFLPLFLIFFIIGCSPKKNTVEESDIPYPPNEDMIYYQAECDSGRQTFWTDIKAVSSAFLNNSRYMDIDVKGDDFIILGEGLYHGQVEIETPDYILELTFERKFKSRGKNAIWQVIAAKEKPWPTGNSKSGR